MLIEASCSSGNSGAMPQARGWGTIGGDPVVQPYIAAAVIMASIFGMSATALAGQLQTPPTTIRTLVLTAEPTKVFGDYRPLATPVLTPGESINIYGEPGDFGWHNEKEVAKFNVVVAVEVRARNGRLIGKVEPRPMQYEATSRPANFFFSLGVRVEDPIGAYDLVVRLRDASNGQVVERVLPFTVANKRQEPSAGGPMTAPAQVAKSATSPERARPLDCKQYFPQTGEMISVQCTQ
jgi:hypothetical protein